MTYFKITCHILPCYAKRTEQIPALLLLPYLVNPVLQYRMAHFDLACKYGLMRTSDGYRQLAANYDLIEGALIYSVDMVLLSRMKLPLWLYGFSGLLAISLQWDEQDKLFALHLSLIVCLYSHVISTCLPWIKMLCGLIKWSGSRILSFFIDVHNSPKQCWFSPVQLDVFIYI